MAVLGTVTIAAVIRTRNGAARPELVLHKVKYDRVELTIVERGALESTKNSDIVCRVRAGNKGGTIASQIKMVIDDGSEVRGPRPEKPTGDLVVDLDSSGLEEQLKTQKIVVDKAESDKIQAEEQYKISVSQNESNIKTAETDVELAAIDLSKYTGIDVEEILKTGALSKLHQELKSANRNATRPARELADEDLKKFKTGEYLQELKDDLGQVETAQSDLTQQEDREAWAFRMAKKGYQTQSQAQSETSRKESYQLSFNKMTLQLDVLVKYKKVRMLTQYVTALEEKQRTLDRVIKQAKSQEAKDRSDRESKKSVWEQELAHYHDIESEIKKCKIYAPQDGMVVYYIPEQARFGGGSQQSIVAQGEPVREGQKLMQIPDLRHMLVNTKVHEALVSRVHPGQKATIRIDSYGNRLLRGVVDSVATVAAQADFMSSDVKVYATKVAINSDDMEGMDLKPGMSAEVTIVIADALEHVLTVPLQSIVGGSEMKSKRTVVVMTPSGPQEREVVIGLSNDKVAEVKEGLQEGDEVVENPKAVLGEKAKVREVGGDNKGGEKGGPGDFGGEKKGGGRGKGKGKGGPPPGMSPDPSGGR